jgi:hypothetical protein
MRNVEQVIGHRFGIALALTLGLLLAGPAAWAQNAVAPAALDAAAPRSLDNATAAAASRDAFPDQNELRRAAREVHEEARRERRELLRDKASRKAEQREARQDRHEERRHDNRELHRDSSIRIRRD